MAGGRHGTSRAGGCPVARATGDWQVASLSSHPGVAVAGDPPVTLAEVAGMTQAQNPL